MSSRTGTSILWPVILLTIGFLSYTAYSYVNMERATIMANWAANRCSPFVMAGAYYLKPDSDPQTAGEFAGNNLQFCIKSLAQEVMTIVMAPVSFVMQDQAQSMNSITVLLNKIRETIATMGSQFAAYFEPIFKTFNTITYQIGITFQKMKSAFQKVNAMLLSTVFIGLSFVTTMNNIIDLTIKVIFIILDIMIALLIILFFVLWPLIPLLIIPVILAISQLGGARGNSAMSRKGSFCFVPETPILLEDGSTCRIDEIQIGARLLSGSTVEGVLVLDGTTTALFELEGIHVSGSHLVKSKGKGKEGWHSVAEDERARHALFRVPQLYCLNTSDRIIPIQNAMGTAVQFRDWEEIDADDEEGMEEWDRMVSRMLGKVTSVKGEADGTFCLMDPAIHVQTSQGFKAIKDLRIGDAIELSFNNSTRVIGLVKGRVAGRGDSGWVSSCIKKISTATYVRQTTLTKSTDPTDHMVGCHVITDSGKLLVNLHGRMTELRDFTEVGVDQIAHTYSFVAKRLNRRK